MNLHDWAVRWSIPFDAFRDLQTLLGLYTPPLPQADVDIRSTKSEAFVQSMTRLEASQKGLYLFRNNNGALKPEGSKRPVRFGLGNDSEQINDLMKSADLIGWRSVVIEQRHVGYKLAQFMSVECKPEGWQYSGNDREPAQLAWANLVNAHGGDARFVSQPGGL